MMDELQVSKKTQLVERTATLLSRINVAAVTCVLTKLFLRLVIEKIRSNGSEFLELLAIFGNFLLRTKFYSS